jgi:hypothetical protein
LCAASVLDITYRKPVQFGATFEASFLGGSLSIDAVSKVDCNYRRSI